MTTLPAVIHFLGFRLMIGRPEPSVNYDPQKDTNGDGSVSETEQENYNNREIIGVESASIEIPKVGVTGEIGGLSVRNNGFGIGTAMLTKDGPINLGGILELDDVRVGVADFGVTFGQAVDFGGEIFIASGGAKLLPGKAVSATIADGPDADTEAVRCALTFADGSFDGFRFEADQLEFTLADVLTVSGSEIWIDTGAEASQAVASFDSLGAQLSAGPLKLSGEMRNFAFLGNGSFQPGDGFGVFFSAEGVKGENLKWPKWLPIQVTQVGIEWEDINTRPADFSLIASAQVNRIPGVPLEFSGAVEGLRIDVGLLQEGRFPVTALESIAVHVGGEFGGAEISGSLIGGILRIDDEGVLLDVMDDETPVADRVLFVGVEGKLEIANKGFQIRFAMSELGPLGVLVSVKAPLVVDPVFTGLTIDELTGGIEFYTALPSITEPEELRDAAFADATEMDADQWLAQVKQQVVTQVQTLKQTPNVPGFLAAFTSPMTLTAQAAISSTYLGSAESFNGQVQLRLSTDGKLFASGKFRFMQNRLIIQGKMYADLTQVAAGNARVRFLVLPGRTLDVETVLDEAPFVLSGEAADAIVFDKTPEQLDAYTVKYPFSGTFGTGPVSVDFVAGAFADLEGNLSSAATNTFTVVGPTAHLLVSAADVNELNEAGYIDVWFEPSLAGSLAPDSITDTEREFNLSGAAADGVTMENDSVTKEDDHTYRYRFTGEFAPGEVTVQFLSNTWTDSNNQGNVAETESFYVLGVTAALVFPRPGVASVSSLNESKSIIVSFRPTSGQTLDPISIDGSEFELVGDAKNDVSISGTPEPIDGEPFQFKYTFTGDFKPGEIEVKFLADAVVDDSGMGLTGSSAAVSLRQLQGEMLSPLHEANVGRKNLNDTGYLQVEFPDEFGVGLDGSLLTDPEPEIELYQINEAGEEVQVPGIGVDGIAQHVDGNIWKYPFSGKFDPGQVFVRFIAGSWEDNAGNEGAESTHTFNVYSNATSF